MTNVSHQHSQHWTERIMSLGVLSAGVGLLLLALQIFVFGEVRGLSASLVDTPDPISTSETEAQPTNTAEPTPEDPQRAAEILVNQVEEEEKIEAIIEEKIAEEVVEAIIAETVDNGSVIVTEALEDSIETIAQLEEKVTELTQEVAFQEVKSEQALEVIATELQNRENLEEVQDVTPEVTDTRTEEEKVSDLVEEEEKKQEEIFVQDLITTSDGTVTCTILASKTNITAGESVRLEWQVSGADRYFAKLDPNLAFVRSDGTRAVTPQETTRYALHLFDQEVATKHIASCDVTVNVAPTQTTTNTARFDLEEVDNTQCYLLPLSERVSCGDEVYFVWKLPKYYEPHTFTDGSRVTDFGASYIEVKADGSRVYKLTARSANSGNTTSCTASVSVVGTCNTASTGAAEVFEFQPRFSGDGEI